ncbi:mitochondrial import inner membrane translocase subunit TIM50-like [Amphiura filiformis]|uniref:mitochondrial import inner membrane translocase subunit TIM50-like n=1 Tax=Amphiura filiformis TaxID=82378 RepID=UPI003B20E213
MAALSGTCIFRNAGRILTSKYNCLAYKPQIVFCKQLANFSSYKIPHICRISTSCVWKIEEQSQKPKSTLPFGELLQQAEQEQKEKEKSDDEKARKKKRKEKIKRIQRWAMGITGALMVGSTVLSIYEMGSPILDEEGKPIPDEYDNSFVLWAYLARTFKELRGYKTMIEEPSAEKLLPDPLSEPYFQPPYTLVLEMTNVLVHPEWTYANGWRFKKRPGVDYFLQQVGPPLFEVVIYTAEQGFTAYPLLDNLDPQGFIMYRLFRDATKYKDGHHVKDLSRLNRDLSKVIIVDCNKKSFELQPQNGVALKKWDGNDEDRILFDLAAFLRTIAMSGVDDVRSVLDFYSQQDDPIEAFKINQARLQEEQDRLAKEQAQSKEKVSLAGSWTKNLLGRR